MKPMDMSGHRFGRLVVVRRIKAIKNAWECVCDCGNTKIINGSNLRGGRTKSCGCYNREVAITSNTIHGHTAAGKVSSEYAIYCSMIQRCHNPNNQAYPDYGGRGIAVCERWRQSFTHFLEDMGERPKGMQLDRKDNNKGYAKENCRWTTQIVNANNKRNNILLHHNGESKTVAEWSRLVPIPEATIRVRLDMGWSHSRILSEPVNSINECLIIARSTRKKYRQERKNGRL